MSSSSRLGFAAVLVLAVCAFSLAVHFVAENLEPVVSQAVFEVAEQAGHSHSHETCEEQFVLPHLTRLPARLFTARPASSALLNGSSFSTSPLLPPPNS